MARYRSDLPVHVVLVARRILLPGPILPVPADIARDIGPSALRDDQFWLPILSLNCLLGHSRFGTPGNVAVVTVSTASQIVIRRLGETFRQCFHLK
jgi:hypothetical protein